MQDFQAYCPSIEFDNYATNPCPCGYHNHPDKECVCGPGVVKRYVAKISGPLLDRIDLHVEVTPVSYAELTGTERPKLNSRDIRARVLGARAVQAERFKDFPDVYSNVQMPGRLVHDVCRLSPEGLALLKTAMERLQLSARAYDRILKVARTAADLSGSADIRIEDLAEAFIIGVWIGRGGQGDLFRADFCFAQILVSRRFYADFLRRFYTDFLKPILYGN